MTERHDLVAIPKPSRLGDVVLRATRAAEGAAGSVLGSVEQLASRIAAEVVESVLAQLDVDAVLARIDVDELVRSVDVDALLDRVDVDRLLERVDVDRLLDRVDVDRLLDRVDVDRLMARVDVDSVVARTQLAPIVREVLDEVDIGAIVMESTGSITGGVVDGVRMQAVDADDLVERLLDTLLLRRHWRRRRDP